MSLTRAAQLLGMVLVASALCALSVSLFRDGEAVAAVWPANALILAFLIRWPTRRSEQVLAVAVPLAGTFAAAVALGSAPVLMGGFVLANIVEITIAYLALGGAGAPLQRIRDLAKFLGVGVLGGAAASGLIGAAFLKATGANPSMLDGFLRWFLADGLGLAIFTPLALGLRRISIPSMISTRALVQGVASQAAVAATAAAIFLTLGAPGLFLLFPVVMLAILANRHIGGPLAVAQISLVAMAANLGGVPLAGVAPQGAVFVLQALLAALVLTAQPLSALVKQLEAYAGGLERDRSRLAALNDNKTRFLAHVSHEIRSPLSGVVTLAQMLEGGSLGQLSERQKQMLASIAASGAEVERLALDLTDTAALQSGKARVNLEPVGTEAAVDDAIAQAKIRAAEYGASFQRVGSTPPRLEVMADPLRLKQILVNILVNGAKYGGRPPIVRIEVRPVPGAVRFEITDNGEGVDPAHLSRLFGEFDRLGAETSRVHGHGLGLALSREFARLQDGRIGAARAIGGGALFWLELPAASLRRKDVA